MRKLLGALASIVLLAFLAVPAASAQTGGATITLLHGIPATPVDVEANGANVFTNFQFGQTQNLSAFAGQTLNGLKVKAAGTATVAIDAGNVGLRGWHAFQAGHIFVHACSPYKKKEASSAPSWSCLSLFRRVFKPRKRNRNHRSRWHSDS